MGVLVLLMLGWLMPGCSSAAAPTLSTPEPHGVGGTDHCAQAEARLEALGCRDRRGDPMWVNRKGERFAQTCRTIQEQGGVFIDPACIAGAESCEEANACPAHP